MELLRKHNGLSRLLRLCGENGCNAPHYAKGYCKKHYYWIVLNGERCRITVGACKTCHKRFKREKKQIRYCSEKCRDVGYGQMRVRCMAKRMKREENEQELKRIQRAENHKQITCERDAGIRYLNIFEKPPEPDYFTVLRDGGACGKKQLKKEE
jgi:hypothetical protein